MIEPNRLEHDWFPRPLPRSVTLGERSWCYSSFSCLHFQSDRPGAVCVGHDTGIYNGTFFDLGPQGEVKIGDFCTLVGGIICTNAKVLIENYAFIAHEVVLADSFAAVPFRFSHDCESSENSHETKTVIHIGENTWICARAILLAGAKLGEGAIVGAAAVVDFEVPPFAIVAGNPAQIVGWSN